MFNEIATPKPEIPLILMLKAKGSQTNFFPFLQKQTYTQLAGGAQTNFQTGNWLI